MSSRFLYLFLALICTLSPADAQVVTLQSVSSSGVAANNTGGSVARISADGRYIAFTSDATNLSPLATNGVRQAYLRDRVAGTTEVASISTTGLLSDGVESDSASVNNTGVLVGFISAGTNFDAVSPSATHSFFIRDRNAQATTRALRTISGAAFPVTSGFLTGGGNPDRIVVTSSGATAQDPGPLSDVNAPRGGSGGVFWQSINIETRRVNMSSNANPNIQQDTGDISNTSFTDTNPSSSIQSRFVCFESTATNLTNPPPTNNRTNIYVRDMDTKQISLVSTYENGAMFSSNVSDCAMSGDGEYVMFRGPGDLFTDGTSAATIQLYRKAWRSSTPAVVRVSLNDNEVSFDSSVFSGTLSNDGRYAAFASAATNGPNATSGFAIYVRDIEGGTTKRVDLATGGVPPAGSNANNPRISSDGEFVVFNASSVNYDSAAIGLANQNGVFLSAVNGSAKSGTPTPTASNKITLKKAVVSLKGRKKLELSGTLRSTSSNQPVIGESVTVTCLKKKNNATLLSKTVKTAQKGLYSIITAIPLASQRSNCTATSGGTVSKKITIP